MQPRYQWRHERLTAVAAAIGLDRNRKGSFAIATEIATNKQQPKRVEEIFATANLN